MQEHRDDDVYPVLTPSLSFRKRDDDRLIPHVDSASPQMMPSVPLEPQTHGATEADEDEEFEFTFAVKDAEVGSPIAADEIFYDGRIRPTYPVFGRGLLLPETPEEEKPKPARRPLRHLFIEEQRESSTTVGSGSEDDEDVVLNELSGIPPDTYCLWTPGSSAGASPARCKKSGSTGSLFRWRIRDLMMGRSQSDGKEKFVFLATDKEETEKEKDAGENMEKKKKANSIEIPRRRLSLDTKTPSPAVAAKNGKGERGMRRRSVSEVEDMDAVAGRRSVGHAAKEGVRQSFLPYKQELIGLFANVNAIPRTYRPF